MQEQDFQVLRALGHQLTSLATVLCLGHLPREAMDRAAQAINIDPFLALDVLVLCDQPGEFRILPGDILVGGGVTCRVINPGTTLPGSYAGRVLTLT